MADFAEKEFSKAQKQLKKWFQKEHALLPWRPLDINQKRDPYLVWISEIMLQQTQVETVKNHFKNWMKDYPEVSILAHAEETDVMQHWQGLGYYSRAKNILKTAKIINEKYGGKFPFNRKELELLPGIGKYTAGAILSLSFHLQEAILDGNLIRIFSRLHKIPFLPRDKKSQDIYWNESKRWVTDSEPYLINEALMEFGRIICKPKNPLCNLCPILKICKAFSEKSVQTYPPQNKIQQENWSGVILIIESLDQKILAVQENHTRFLKNQKTLPMFEYSKVHPKGLPSAVEEWIRFDDISDFHWMGSPIRHTITRFKMECAVLHITLKTNAPVNNSLWIPLAQSSKNFANRLSLKALNCLINK